MTKEELFELKNKIDLMASLPEKKRQKEVIDRILNQKLERSYNDYAELLTKKIDYILMRNNYRVIKAMNRKNKDDNNE